MSQESSGATRSTPRIPISSINGEGLNQFFSVLHGRVDNCWRRIEVNIVYSDGSTTAWYNIEHSYTSEYIEFNIRSSSPFDKDVVEMKIVGAYGYKANGKAELVVWRGSTDNPVFKAGDTANFKLRIKTNYTAQQG